LGHFDSVGHGRHTLGVAGQVACPLFDLIAVGPAIEKNNAVHDLNLRSIEPPGGLHDAQEALSDLLVVGEWLHGHRCRRERRLLFLGRR